MEPAKPHEELLAELAEAIQQVRDFLDEAGAPLDAVISSTGLWAKRGYRGLQGGGQRERPNPQAVRDHVPGGLPRFRASITVPAVKEHRAARDAISIVYESLRSDREQADISGIMRELQAIVDEAIKVLPGGEVDEAELYNISAIDFDKLQSEFAKSQEEEDHGPEPEGRD